MSGRRTCQARHREGRVCASFTSFDGSEAARPGDVVWLNPEGAHSRVVVWVKKAPSARSVEQRDRDYDIYTRVYRAPDCRARMQHLCPTCPYY